MITNETMMDKAIRLKIAAKKTLEESGSQLKNKAAQKSIIESLNYSFSYFKRIIQDEFLKIPHESRGDKQRAVYHDMPDLHVWKVKASIKVLDAFPVMSDVVQHIEDLVELRKLAVETEIAPKVTKEQAQKDKIAIILDKKAVAAIYEKISEGLVPFDNLNLKQLIKFYSWAHDAVSKIKMDCTYNEFVERLTAQGLTMDHYTFVKGRPLDSVIYSVNRDHEFSCIKRNLKIATNLAKLDIKSVADGNIEANSDGFNGMYEVETPKGTKTVIINTIVAGGYNIQCAHLRVLVKVV